MIQLNLLPDVKLEYIKAQKTRRLVAGISVIVTAVAVALLVIMLLFGFVQKDRINSLKSHISTDTSELEGKPSIKTVLTVQNQLKTLTSLYSSRPAAYRLFSSYLNEVTPEAISLNELTVDFTENTLTVTGNTNNLTSVNQYVDTLKSTTFSVGKSKESGPAFTNVVLSDFSIDSQTQNPNQAASFTINLSFTPTIFESSENVKLSIPNITVTHSEQQDTASLFKAAPVTSDTTGGQ